MIIIRKNTTTTNLQKITHEKEIVSSKSIKREAVAKRCSVKKVFLKISQNSQENTCARVSFLIKLQEVKKETLTQVFSGEFYEISKKTFSCRTPLLVAYENNLNPLLHNVLKSSYKL